MKKLLVLSAGIAWTVSLSAQNSTPTEIHYPDGSVYKECYYVRETKPLREILADLKAKGLDKLKPKSGPEIDGKAYEEFAKKKRMHAPGNSVPDPVLQSGQGHQIAIAGQDFEGQPGYGGYPLDPNGMIGSNYYVQTINSSYAAWDKTGNVYIAQTDLDNLFGKVGQGDCGDPITIYDKIADRWVISEFEGGLTNSNYDTLLFAVSQTNDPAGAYWVYAFDPYVNDFNDYPKYTVWGNGYYMTCNCNNPDMVVAYQRDKMIIGATAAFIAMPWNYGPGLSGCEGNFFCPQLLDCDGTLPPANAPEYLFYYWEQDWGCGGGADSIIIEQINVNWTSRTGSINAKFQHLIVNNFNSNFPFDFDANIPQPGNIGSDYLASSDGFFSYRIPYLSWPSYNSAVMCFPVNIGTLNAPVAAIRWYELHQDTTTKLWSAYQQSTYGPNDGVSRWMGSIAMNMNGDIGLEYSVSSTSSVYPGIRYTGRRYCDVLNSMTMAEGIAATGNTLVNTPQGNGMRWGDYSHLSVDPTDGKTFWGTNMYAENGVNGNNIGTRIFSFQVPICTTDAPTVDNSDNATFKAYQNGSNLNIAGTDFPQNERLVVQLFDANGKMLMQKEMETNSRTLETSFNISSLAKAVYLVRVGNDHIQRVVKVAIK